MLDAAKAADYYVVAWCKNWTLRQYLTVCLEKEFGARVTPEEVEFACATYSWLPVKLWNYTSSRLVRAHAEDSFPRLSAWLHGRADDIARLKCSSQILKLKDRGAWKENMRPESGAKEYRELVLAAHLDSVRKKSHQRSAWNVCKA